MKHRTIRVVISIILTTALSIAIITSIGGLQHAYASNPLYSYNYEGNNAIINNNNIHNMFYSVEKRGNFHNESIN